VHVVNVGGGQSQSESQPGKPHPRILHIIDKQGTTGLSGFYIRLPDTAFNAYGDLLPECESRGVVWAGNKIFYVASDAVSAAFQYEIRLDVVVAADLNGVIRAEGAVQLERPLQEMYGGLYFPIPIPWNPFLFPVVMPKFVWNFIATGLICALPRTGLQNRLRLKTLRPITC
jgi:hypothetical protein